MTSTSKKVHSEGAATVNDSGDHSQDSSKDDGNSEPNLLSMLDIDKILDAIPDERKGRRYTDGWDPERLDEELKQHPFFLKDVPIEGEAVSPLIEGLQLLKYSPDENTPGELAKNYKEDGIFHYKIKKYRVAVLCFTEGIKCLHFADEIVKSDNDELVAQLYNNRAAAQFYLQNYRSALKDCEKAFQLKPDYFKTVFKALECCMKMNKFDKAIEYCTKCEKLDSSNKDVAKFRLQAMKKLKHDKAGGRKSEVKRQAQEKQNAKIMSYVASRKIKCRNASFLDNDSAQHKVKIGDDDALEWPVIFFYPQFSLSDFIEGFHENSTFLDHLTEILENERPPWDKNNEYHIETVGVYFIDALSGGYAQVSLNQTLGEIMQDPRFELPANGISGFFIMASDNDMCKAFLKRLHDAGVGC